MYYLRIIAIFLTFSIPKAYSTESLCYKGEAVKNYQEDANYFTHAVNLEKLLTKSNSIFARNKKTKLKNVTICIDPNDNNTIHVNIDNRKFKFKIDSLNTSSNKPFISTIPVIGWFGNMFQDFREVRFAQIIPFSVNEDGEIGGFSFQILDSENVSFQGYRRKYGKYVDHVYIKGFVTNPSRLPEKEMDTLRDCAKVGLWNDINQSSSKLVDDNIKKYLEFEIKKLRSKLGNLNKLKCSSLDSRTLSAVSQTYMAKLLLKEKKLEIQSIDERHLKACSYRALFDESNDLSAIMNNAKKPFLSEKTQLWISTYLQSLRGNNTLSTRLDCEKIRKSSPELLSMSMLKVLEELELQDIDDKVHNLTCAQFETIESEDSLSFTCALAILHRKPSEVQAILKKINKLSMENIVNNKIFLRIIGLRSVLKSLDEIQCPIITYDKKEAVVASLLSKNTCPNYKKYGANKKRICFNKDENLNYSNVRDLYDTPWKYLVKLGTSKKIHSDSTLSRYNKIVDNMLKSCPANSDGTLWNHMWALEYRCLTNILYLSVNNSCTDKIQQTCNSEDKKGAICIREEIKRMKTSDTFCIDINKVSDESTSHRWSLFNFL